MKTKEPIRLRQRKTSTGLISLYLDYYIKGQRSYEYLSLYLIPEKNRDDKRKNNETMQLAEAIKAKRLVELRNGEYGFKQQDKSEALFYDYFVAQTAKKKTPKTKSLWVCALKSLELYDRKLKARTWREINKRYIQGYIEYLNSTEFKENTKYIYFTKLVSCCNQAVKDGIINKAPTALVDDKPRGEQTVRAYLTIDEVRALANTKCKHQRVKDAFLFSCLTGLRYSDVTSIKWGNVSEHDGITRITFSQQKTKGLEYLDITAEAAELMGEREGDNTPVFELRKSKIEVLLAIRAWCLHAGITKHITFHCARHTFATMMIELDTDLYTVSKLLGHRNIATTQIYAKIVDKKKQEAALKIPKILPKK